MKDITPLPKEDPLDTLKRCDGYYHRPPGGPLVAYAGSDNQGRKYVGEIYINFAKAETHGNVLREFARALLEKFPQIQDSDAGFCGAPEGGKALAVSLAIQLGRRYLFPEKKVTAIETETSREKSILVWKRHQPQKGQRLWLVEDVCNNFSTTADMIKLIEETGAEVVGIICFCNRSLTVDEEYSPSEGRTLPVLALVRKPIMEYRQDDPFVAVDVKANNVVWRVKDEWHLLPPSL